MFKSLFALPLFLITYLNAQQALPEFDGVVNQEEWAAAQEFLIEYEIEPGDNTTAPQKTTVYVTYSPTDLYVGFVAEANMNDLHSSIRNRDEGWQDDNVMIGFDT